MACPGPPAGGYPWPGCQTRTGRQVTPIAALLDMVAMPRRTPGNWRDPRQTDVVGESRKNPSDTRHEWDHRSRSEGRTIADVSTVIATGGDGEKRARAQPVRRPARPTGGPPRLRRRS